ncbi:hypothetical protein DMB66_02315 [Actinoplanes sp. ATCC 53533]|uniref:hypothetical protein n=1 Tax=Actinoplanes sp. ATCC 53533 TaxID=1288362 RepID=UPI000F771591|nr:hypothetical protein [Actinoplanes sp. ATCC 53533]RSM74261.1 hypothetical protein DMB66_02315 [Actinoplanes sp. ATCC 53533]
MDSASAAIDKAISRSLPSFLVPAMTSFLVPAMTSFPGARAAVVPRARDDVFPRARDDDQAPDRHLRGAVLLDIGRTTVRPSERIAADVHGRARRGYVRVVSR